MKEDKFIPESKITYLSGISSVTVEVKDIDLDYSEFMELIEALINSSGYSKHEIDSYILEWADDIKATKNN
tara:strand:+ start:185 stop:397 length:213 start_codon:yes stop_codon:yes gene_type:complete